MDITQENYARSEECGEHSDENQGYRAIESGIRQQNIADMMGLSLEKDREGDRA